MANFRAITEDFLASALYVSGGMLLGHALTLVNLDKIPYKLAPSNPAPAAQIAPTRPSQSVLPDWKKQGPVFIRD